MLQHWIKVQDWDCANNGHDWVLIPSDQSVCEHDYIECAQCGKIRKATEQEVDYKKI